MLFIFFKNDQFRLFSIFFHHIYCQIKSNFRNNSVVDFYNFLCFKNSEANSIGFKFVLVD